MHPASPDGEVRTEEDDIAPADGAIRFRSGWFPLDREARNGRLTGESAELLVQRPAGASPDLEAVLEPGSSFRAAICSVQLQDEKQRAAEWRLHGPGRLAVRLPLAEGESGLFRFVPSRH